MESGYINNQYVVRCGWCGNVQRFNVDMTANSLAKIAEVFSSHAYGRPGHCRRCGVDLRLNWREFDLRQSEIDAMTKAARWMTLDRGGRAPTAQELYAWLERNPIEPYEWERNSDEDFDE